jgi:predicted TPR repeat methyltransferase
MYRDALELGSLSAAIFERIARTHAAMHHYRQAISEYAKAARLRPEDPSLRLAKIDLFITTGNLQRASMEVDACDSILQV